MTFSAGTSSLLALLSSPIRDTAGNYQRKKNSDLEFSMSVCREKTYWLDCRHGIVSVWSLNTEFKSLRFLSNFCRMTLWHTREVELGSISQDQTDRLEDKQKSSGKTGHLTGRTYRTDTWKSRTDLLSTHVRQCGQLFPAAGAYSGIHSVFQLA